MFHYVFRVSFDEAVLKYCFYVFSKSSRQTPKNRNNNGYSVRLCSMHTSTPRMDINLN